MLLQSHEDAVVLLPALPAAWKNGAVKGLRARGGFEVDMEWADGKLKQCSIRSQRGGLCRIRSHTQLKTKDGSNIREAFGANSNPHYELPCIKKVNSAGVGQARGISAIGPYEYDIQTAPGAEFELFAK
jgi:alpha-L-fucosidase 2